MANRCRRVFGASLLGGHWGWRKSPLLVRLVLAAFALLILKPIAGHAQASTCVEDSLTGQAICSDPTASDYSGNYELGEERPNNSDASWPDLGASDKR